MSDPAVDPGGVRRLLVDAGAVPEDVERAAADGTLPLLGMETLLLPGGARYTQAEVAERADVPVATARELWLALGLPGVEDDAVAFDDADVEALSAVGRLLREGAGDIELGRQLARVVGASMSRIADAQVAAALAGTAGDEPAVARPDALVQVLEAFPRLLDYTWRRHLQAAARRRLLARSPTDAPELTVGFADLVGFTALSQQVDDEQLARVVERFAATAFAAVADGGGTVVKMIGDEVMFVVAEPAAAVHIGLGLAEAYSAAPDVPDVRVALAHGRVLVREGDYFGPVVNLASRSVGVALPGSVVVTAGVHERLAGVRELDVRPLRPRALKDIGLTPLWRVRHGGGPLPPAVVRLRDRVREVVAARLEERRARRWRRPRR